MPFSRARYWNGGARNEAVICWPESSAISPSGWDRLTNSGLSFLYSAMPYSLASCHLQVHGLDRLACAGHGDAILVGELLDALVGMPADEEDRQRAQRTDALDVDVAARPVPGRHHRRDAAGADVDRAGDQPVVDRHGIAEHRPLGREGWQAGLGSVLLDELLVQHDRERQIADAELAHEVHLAHLGARRAAPRRQRRPQCRCEAVLCDQIIVGVLPFWFAGALVRGRLCEREHSGALTGARHTSALGPRLVLRLPWAASMKRHR